MEITSALIQAIASPFGAAGIDFAVICSVLFVAFLVYGKHMALNAECGHLGKTCERLDGKADALATAVHEMRGDIQYIKSTLNSFLNASQRGEVQPLMRAHSPLALTETGRNAAAEMNAEAAVAENWDAIRARLDTEIPSANPYDIQTFCLERIPVYPNEFIGGKCLADMKLYAFRHGLTLFDCLKVVGMVVRDAYLKEKGIPLAALDGKASGAVA